MSKELFQLMKVLHKVYPKAKFEGKDLVIRPISGHKIFAKYIGKYRYAKHKYRTN